MSEPNNPYEAPKADLQPGPEHTGGSIENTLAGNADLDIGAVVSEAWRRTKGIKGMVIGGGLVVYLAVLVVSLILGFAFGMGEQQSPIGAALGQFVIMLIIYPFFAGVFVLGLRQSVGLPVNFAQQFSYYGAALPILGVAILQSIATLIGFLLLVIPGIYLGFALALAVPLKVEKQLPIIECLATSLKLVNRKFLGVAVLLLLASIVSALSFVTIIGWIWAIPWMVMVYAIIYRQLAGCDIQA